MMRTADSCVATELREGQGGRRGSRSDTVGSVRADDGCPREEEGRSVQDRLQKSTYIYKITAGWLVGRDFLPNVNPLFLIDKPV